MVLRPVGLLCHSFGQVFRIQFPALQVGVEAEATNIAFKFDRHRRTKLHYCQYSGLLLVKVSLQNNHNLHCCGMKQQRFR
jgi:hypothetical protein